MIEPIGKPAYVPPFPSDQNLKQLATELRSKIDHFRKGIESLIANSNQIDDPTQLSQIAQILTELDTSSQKAAQLKG